MRKRYSVVVLGAALTALSATFAYGAGAYGGGHCDQAVVGQLEELGVDMDDVRNFFYTLERRSSRDDTRVVGIDGWVKFHSCKGSLVIRMSTRCRVKTVYTRHECRVPGVPHY